MNRRPLTSLNTVDGDLGAQISRNGLRIWFESDRGGNQDLYTSQRPDRSAPFDPPTKITEVSSPAFEAGATLTEDELEMYFQRLGTQFCLYATTRADRTMPWAPPVMQAQLCTGASVGGAYLSGDGLRLYYNTTIDAHAEGALLVTSRASRNDLFPAGTPIAGLEGGANKGYVGLSEDELTIYYENTVGPVVQPWVATRRALDAPFENAHAIAELATSTNEGDLSITADGTELVFADEVGGGKPDLFIAQRSCL